MIAGRVEAIVDSHAGLQGAIAAGKVKVLAVTSARRLPDHPDLPTVAETLPGFRSMGWFALLARRVRPSYRSQGERRPEDHPWPTRVAATLP